VFVAKTFKTQFCSHSCNSKDYKKMLYAFDDLLKTKSDKLNINDYSLAIYYNIINDDEQKANLYIDQAIEKFPKSELFY